MVFFKGAPMRYFVMVIAIVSGCSANITGDEQEMGQAEFVSRSPAVEPGSYEEAIK